MKAIKMRFALLDRRKELMISISTGSTANGISGSTIHTTLRVNNKADKNY